MSHKKIAVGMLCFLTKCIINENNGRVVVVIAKAKWADSWWIQSTTKMPYKHMLPDGSPTEITFHGTELSVHASQLIPINDPDSSTGDESHAWLPAVPKAEEVHA